ncbi:Signal transduction histidine kinase [Lutibacter agarilyticus]|uniref:histidine kinase n=1 Tax=Lutibacter agarilyticus TaxID=1109740 RepID=A0A238V8U3_9FLAO|nr:hybrid sensor histidine kinase/response regulator transcription factor [Lutibacter agarilyticus]SNR30825.1 Signal transduction histidine kinase [Lutibacter agarilyticus]
MQILNSKSYSLSIVVNLFLGIFFTSISYGQYSLGFDHLTTENGLSQSDVNCIYQDKDGFMWFGTHDGLNRYDGYNFTIFKPDPTSETSISSNLIWKIVDDENGNLWIGTTGGGLNYFDKNTEKFTRFQHDEYNSNSLISNHITQLYRDSKSRLWIGTTKGIDLIDLEKPIDSIKIQHFNLYQNEIISSMDGNSVFSIFEDSRNQLWVGGIRGLSKLIRDQNGDIYFQLVNKYFERPNIPVRTIAEDRFGNLLIGSSAGLYRYLLNNDTYKSQFIRAGNFTKIVVDKEHIWAGTSKGLLDFKNISDTLVPIMVSLYKYDPENPTQSLSKDHVKSLFIDRTGIVWAGADGGGVNKFDPQRKQFLHIQKTLDPGSIANNNLRSMYEDSNGYLWLGSNGGGLNMLPKKDIDRKFNKFKHLTKINKPFAIEEVIYNNSKKILVGGENSPGLFEIDIEDPAKISNAAIKPIREITNSVFSIMQDSYKNIWIGTYNGGVHRWLLDKDSADFKKDILSENKNIDFSISNNIIRDILQDSKGNIWFATGNGLCKITPDQIHTKNPKFEIYKSNPNDSISISHNYILTVFESKSGEIWIGTFGGGLNKLITSNDGEIIGFKTFSINEGLPNSVVKGILEDDNGNLWLSTNKGLSRFNIDQESFKNYDANDGLQSNEFSELTCLKRKNGELLFGGVNGFTAFFPNEIKNNDLNAETVFTQFSIFNKPVAIGEEINGRVILDKSINKKEQIDLKYSENSFSFEFAALHYAASKKNNYKYKLEGFNENWIFTTSNNRYATYTNLEPGLYTLKVMASNNDGVWDKTPIQLKINVIPPFWRTEWAKVFYVFIILGLLLAFRRFTVIRTTKKHELELEHLEKEKLEEINRLKLEFFTNISHEFRTPLTLIKGPLEYLQKKGSDISHKEVSDQYQLMKKNTDYLLRLVNQLLDFRKMDKGKMELLIGENDVVSFLKEIGEPFQFLSLKKDIDFQIKSSEKNIKSYFDKDALEKIINNLLSNAFKFTPEKGKVSVEVFNGKDFECHENLNLNIDVEKYILIQVSDSGPGIPEHRVKHVFERFYTNVGSKNINKGTGIGLSFTKNLVELHQGSISVLSDPSFGTSFFVCLPKNKNAYDGVEGISFYDNSEGLSLVSQTEAATHAIEVMDDIVDKGLSRTRSKLPVLLIVDDNADIRSFIKRGLGEEYYIYEAEDGEKGFELAKNVVPNIIITDLMMPIMDGIELCDKLKTTQETSHIPVIMLTAKTSQEWEIEGLKTGADAYIRKPFDMELLKLKLKNILNYRDELRRRFNRDTTLQPNEVTVTSTDEIFLNKAIEIVEKHMMNSEFSVELLVKEMSLSRSNLYLKIKELTGLSSSEFIRNIRLKRAVQLLEQSDLSVKEIMYMTGFNTASYFSKCFKKQFGVIPSKYVRQSGVNSDFDEEEIT